MSKEVFKRKFKKGDKVVYNDSVMLSALEVATAIVKGYHIENMKSYVDINWEDGPLVNNQMSGGYYQYFFDLVKVTNWKKRLKR